MAVLDLFGMPSQTMRIDEVEAGRLQPPAGCAIVASSDCIARAAVAGQWPADALPGWMRAAGSVYIYGFDEAPVCRRLLRALTGDAHADVRRLTSPSVSISISDRFPEMCGPLSGQTFRVSVATTDRVFEVRVAPLTQRTVISSDDQPLLLELTGFGVPLYLHASAEAVDLSAPSAVAFDVRTAFTGSVPFTMYAKWALAGSCWTTSDTSACLIVDDPLLKRRYGFLDFRKTLEQMDRHDFTTTIGFIPWNWKRTSRSTVAMFGRRPDRFSVSVHGCDHTGGEFAIRRFDMLSEKTRRARQRMDLLQRRTALRDDRVMVFPQGAFSPESGRALKLNGLVAAANTEVAPARGATNETTIRDLWSPAILRYGAFPIFTRRYIDAGVENFAFDAMLGKPCLIVAHHDVFKDAARELVDVVDRLNRLNWNLQWRTLGAAVMRSYAIKPNRDGATVRMFASALELCNPTVRPWRVDLTKDEPDADRVRAIEIDRQQVTWRSEDGQLRFTALVAPHHATAVRVIYESPLVGGASRLPLREALAVPARRYLSEVRDNYLSRSHLLSAGAKRMKRVLLGQ